MEYVIRLASYGFKLFAESFIAYAVFSIDNDRRRQDLYINSDNFRFDDFRLVLVSEIPSKLHNLVNIAEIASCSASM